MIPTSTVSQIIAFVIHEEQEELAIMQEMHQDDPDDITTADLATQRDLLNKLKPCQTLADLTRVLKTNGLELAHYAEDQPSNPE